MRGTRPERALEQGVERTNAIRAGERVLIACSGGSDSVGLAAVLASIAKRLDLTLTLGHVNHGLRESAWQDEAVVLRVSAALNIPVKVAALQMRKRGEADLRDARYDALASMAAQAGATCVATAHTAEDQTETVLLALFRGTGPAGLSGIPERRPLAPGVDVVRPLLGAERAEVRGYAQTAGLPFAVDPTNADLELRRNAVREALGALRPAFPGLDSAVARAARLVAAELAGTPEAGLRRAVRETLEQHEALRGVDFEHIEAAVRALRRGRSGRFSMGGGLELKIDKGHLTVHRERG